jgi:hypothetical protein
VVLPNEAKGVAENTLESHGYCLVTFNLADVSPYRKEYEGLVKGKTKFTAEYNDKYYVFASEDSRLFFMR